VTTGGTTTEAIRLSFEAAFPPELVREVLAAHLEVKANFYLGGLRLSAVEGGRFSESVYRLLEFHAFGGYTPLGSQLDTDALTKRLANLARGTQSDSVRLHIPRALRVIYDIRNNRDTAHLGDGIDPNLQDATLVVALCDWVLAELVRLHHSVDATTAQAIVDDLVSRKAPVIQDFDGFLKVLRTDLSAREMVLVLLYQRGARGATLDELRGWVRPQMRANLKRTLDAMADERAWTHRDGQLWFITRTGQQVVDANGWLLPS
jgi:hypothetical protein